MDNPALLIMIAAAVTTAALAVYGASGVDPRDALAADPGLAATALAALALPPPRDEPARPDDPGPVTTDSCDVAEPHEMAPRPPDQPLDATLSNDEHARLLLEWCQSDRDADGVVTPRPLSVITDADLIYLEMCAELLLVPHRWNRVGGVFNALTVSASGNAKAYATDKAHRRYRIYTIPAHPSLAADSAPMQRAA